MKQLVEDQLYIELFSYEDWKRGNMFHKNFISGLLEKENYYYIPADWDYKKYPVAQPGIIAQLEKVLPDDIHIVKCQRRILKTEYQKIQEDKERFFNQKVKAQMEWYLKPIQSRLKNAKKPIALLEIEVKKLQDILTGKLSAIVSSSFTPGIIVFHQGDKKGWNSEVKSAYSMYILENRIGHLNHVTYKWKDEQDYLTDPVVVAFFMSDLKDWCENEIQKLKEVRSLNESQVVNGVMKPKKKLSRKLYTYQWHGKDRLYDAWRKLKQFFTPNESYENFKIAFSKTLIDENFTPLRWYNSNASELLFFVVTLINEELIPKPKRMNYHQLKAIFVDVDGKRFEASFKNIKQLLEINLSETKQKKIVSILSRLQ